MRWSRTSWRRTWCRRAQLVLARVLGEHRVLDGVEPVPEFVDERKRVVDEPVDDRVQQPVRTPAHAAVQIPRHGVDRLVRLVVNGDQIALADEDVDLVGGDAVAVESSRRQPREEQAVWVDVELGACLGVAHVFDRKCVEVESCAELVQHRVVRRGDVHPNQARARREGLQRRASTRLDRPGLVDPSKGYRRH